MVATYEQFGRDRSRCFASEKLALEWFDKLTAELYRRISKVVSGVAEEVKDVFGYQVA